MMENRYKVAIQESRIWSVEIFISKNLVASAIICVEDFPYGDELLKISFLSQVIVTEKFRGLGFLKLVMSSVREMDSSLNCQASIVIARRAVGDLYSKYGYKGFGIFPELKIQGSVPSLINGNDKLINESLLRSLSNAYRYTYWQLPGSTVRSDAKWLLIISEAQYGIYKLKYEQSGGDICYAIIRDELVIEFAFTSEDILEKFLVNQYIQPGTIFKIGSNHPAFKSLLKLGGLYSIRPEPLEGHMIRSYEDSKIMSKFLEHNTANSITTNNVQKKYSIEIPELSQW